MDVLDEILGRMRGLAEMGDHKPPVTVLIPPAMEARFYQLRWDRLGGELYGRMVVEGVRAVFKTVFGLKPVWDAGHFAVSSTEIVEKEK